MEWQVEYYKKENGDIPILDYLLSLEPKLRAKAFSETPQRELDRALRYKEDYERRCDDE
jgi:hypothetical protein